MNADLQSRFDLLDQALSTLVDSLASYNPSPSAAASLVTADDHLALGLDRLASHQRNYQEIQALRSTADSLDDRVKATLLRLAEMRKNLRTSNSRAEADTLREIDHDQLLSYAQHISRFTVPPTYKPSLPPPIDGAAVPAPQQFSSNSATRAATAPHSPRVDSAAGGAAPNDLAGVTPNANSPIPPAPSDPFHLASGSGEEGKAMAALPPAVRAWLEPASFNVSFMPWPEEDSIRKGALGSIEESWRKGLDPSERDIASEVHHGDGTGRK